MSVQVNFIPGCRHGNQLCQHVVGRIISNKLRFKLSGIDINHREFALHGFDLGYNRLDYLSYSTPIQQIGTSCSYEYSDTLNWAHPDLNLEDVYNDPTPRKIILEGFFQRKKYFIPYTEQIKQWYGFIKTEVPDNHVAMHIRLGDLKQTNHPDLLPLEYYIEALKFANADKVTICTDTPSDEYVQYFVKNHDATLFNGNERETIMFLASHNNLVLSVGSFSFWASLFCEGTNVINAIPTKGNNRIDPNNGVDLLIQSPNHKYITL